MSHIKFPPDPKPGRLACNACGNYDVQCPLHAAAEDFIRRIANEDFLNLGVAAIEARALLAKVTA